MTATEFKLLIVGDHVLFLQGLTRLLQDHLGAEVRTARWESVEETLRHWRPDVIVGETTDVLAVGGMLAETCRAAAELPVVVIAPGDRQQLFAAMRAGARGFVPRDTGTAQLLGCLRAVRDGGWGIPRSLTGDLVQEYVALAAIKPVPTGDELTTRDRQIIRLLVQGHSTRQIGRELSMPASTIHYAIQTLAKKLGVANRMQVITEAMRRDLVDLG